MSLLHQLMLFFFMITSFSQELASGFYIIYKPPKKTPCEKELRMLVRQAKVCISKKPIINIEELDYITEIQYDPNSKKNYVDIGISSAGIQILNKAANSLPDTKFALVLQDDVICIFSIKEEIGIRYIRIGEDAELKDLILVHDALSKAKF